MSESVNSVKETGDETEKLGKKFVDDFYAVLRH